jgi:integrase
MARRGQVGTIAVSGKWYVVRFWKYPPGQDRVHASERICPADSNARGYLPKGERRRRANAIVEASGVNDKQQFVETHNGATFREQAEWFLNHSAKRKRNPVKPKTIESWQSCINKWLNPNLGDLPLASINNATLKALIAKMDDASLSAQSIVTYTNLVKLVVASAIDENGEELFPRKWNNEFIDLPMVENQYQPIFTAETVNAIVQTARGQDQVLYVLLAATGLRVDLQTPKTKSAYRQVDVCIAVAGLLKSFIGDRKLGLVFANSAGKPLSQTNVIRRSLHPILKVLAVNQAGFHAMRRFRTTWLRKQRAPEDLIRFWLGHAKSSVTDGYSKLADDLEYRLEVTEKIGAGFTVPASMRPMRPRKSVKTEIEIAA